MFKALAGIFVLAMLALPAAAQVRDRAGSTFYARLHAYLAGQAGIETAEAATAVAAQASQNTAIDDHDATGTPYNAETDAGMDSDMSMDMNMDTNMAAPAVRPRRRGARRGH